jgi:hypothetical protein
MSQNFIPQYSPEKVFAPCKYFYRDGEPGAQNYIPNRNDVPKVKDKTVKPDASVVKALT